jgi:hypothetical protein
MASSGNGSNMVDFKVSEVEEDFTAVTFAVLLLMLLNLPGLTFIADSPVIV